MMFNIGDKVTCISNDIYTLLELNKIYTISSYFNSDDIDFISLKEINDVKFPDKCSYSEYFFKLNTKQNRKNKLIKIYEKNI